MLDISNFPISLLCKRHTFHTYALALTRNKKVKLLIIQIVSYCHRRKTYFETKTFWFPNEMLDNRTL